jgi:hypothetical protein
MLDKLRGEGLTDLEFMVVTQSGFTWEDHASGYDDVLYPVMPDTAGVYYVYGAQAYDVVLVDRKGRLVSKEKGFYDETMVNFLNQRLRDLHAE